MSKGSNFFYVEICGMSSQASSVQGWTYHEDKRGDTAPVSSAGQTVVNVKEYEGWRAVPHYVHQMSLSTRH